jgi:hypothetical protein
MLSIAHVHCVRGVQQPQLVRQQILARGRYGAGGVVREQGATPQSTTSTLSRQGLQQQQQQQHSAPQLESVHVTAMRTLQQLRESADPAVAPFAAAAAELFSNNSMAVERQTQRNLGLMGIVLMDQVRGSAARAAVHD